MARSFYPMKAVPLGWLLALFLVLGPSMAAGSIAWGTCSDTLLQKLKAKCGFVSVPLDYKKPSGTKIKIQVSIVKHTSSDAAYQGVMVVAGAGLSLRGPAFTQYFPKDVAAAYDWLGFIQRGLKGSQPALVCTPNYLQNPLPDYIPSTAALEQKWLNRSKAYATACGKNSGTLLPHITSQNIAKDIEQIRIALKADQLNFYALSYLTYATQIYATLYPNRTRRIMLDSSVNPKAIGFQTIVDQMNPVEKNAQKWFSWISKYDQVYHLGTTASKVEEQWQNALKALKSNPIKGIIGSAEWTELFFVATSTVSEWPTLAAMFSSWVKKKNSTLLIQYFENVYPNDNQYAYDLAIDCGDGPWPSSWSSFKSTISDAYSTAPTFTWSNAWYYAPCVFWPYGGDTPLNIGGDQTGKMLLIADTLDPFTPLAGGLEVRRRFKKASLIGVDGALSHVVTATQNRCAANLVFEFFRSGKTPARKAGNVIDQKCAALPAPKPDA